MKADWLFDAFDKKIPSEAVDALQRSLSIQHIVFSIKKFDTVTYYSSQKEGISLQFELVKESSQQSTQCRAIDIYNQDGVKGWSAFVGLPLQIVCTTQDNKENTLTLDVDTRGVDIVSQLGEPLRKGGGEPMKGGGASGLGPGAWMEWSVKCSTRPILIMIELSGQEARGQDRWEKQRAGSARWGICTLSLPDY